MKERGKALEVYSNDMEFYSSSSSDFHCKKHPSSSSSSSVGVCADCLKDRLMKLVCSDCGEQRLSSCSCSEISSNRNSCSVEIGSVGRVSFLIENERNGVSLLGPTPNKPKLNQDVLLERSSSSCVEIKKNNHNGFWKIGKFFKKKRDNKGCERSSVAGFDEKSDICMVDYMGVSRSRSLCSFRGGGGFFGSEDGGDMVVSGGRSSISGARTSSVNGGLVCDSARRSGFSETEPRKSGFESDHKESVNFEIENGFNSANRRVFSLKESDFNGMDESGFIDFKLDFTSETRPEFSVSKMGSLSNTTPVFGSMRAYDMVAHECGGRGLVGSLAADGISGNGGSCRITVSDRGIKKGRKSLKAWRWIFKHPPNWANARKKGEDLIS